MAGQRARLDYLLAAEPIAHLVQLDVAQGIPVIVADRGRKGVVDLVIDQHDVGLQLEPVRFQVLQALKRRPAYNAGVEDLVSPLPVPLPKFRPEQG